MKTFNTSRCNPSYRILPLISLHWSMVHRASPSHLSTASTEAPVAECLVSCTATCYQLLWWQNDTLLAWAGRRQWVWAEANMAPCRAPGMGDVQGIWRSISVWSESSMLMDAGTWNVDNVVQDCGNSIANALELPQSCAKPLASDHLHYWPVNNSEFLRPVIH